MQKNWLKSVIFEDKPKQAEETKETPALIQPQQKVNNHPRWPIPEAIPMPQGVATPLADSNLMYDKLKQNTSVELLPTLQKIFALAKPLEGIITDPVVRLKAAFAQASTQGLTTVDITHDLTKLDGLLKSEQDNFTASVQKESQAISSSEAKAADLEKQLHDLRLDISERKNKLDIAQAGFASALSRRQTEVVQLKSQLSSLGVS